MNTEHQTMSERLLLTPREAAKALSICEKTIYTLTKSGELPAVRIGRSVRYALEDLRAFIERTKKYSQNSQEGLDKVSDK